MNALKRAVTEYASKHANGDGLAFTKVPGLRMMCVRTPSGPLHSVYRPLVCLILQGSKRMVVGSEDKVLSEGNSVIVTADVPVAGTVVTASSRSPYLAIAIDLNVGMLQELAAEMLTPTSAPASVECAPLFVQNIDGAALDCALRLMRLLDQPAAIPILHQGIMRELHYWLLAGEHGATLRSLSMPDSNSYRLAAAIALLRKEFRSRVPVSHLADAAAMSLTAFHMRFKQLTLLTPNQFQKRLRLIEARRLMVQEGSSASQAAFNVGYESISQFTREYARMFGAPPKRDSITAALRRERGAPGLAASEPDRAELKLLSQPSCGRGV